MLKIFYWVLLLAGSGLCLVGLMRLAYDRGTWLSASLFATGFAAIWVGGIVSRAKPGNQ